MLRTLVLPLLAAAALLVPAAGATAQSSTTTATTVKATTVKVLAGSPSEFKFKLSKSVVKKGAVVFRVTNRGNLPHDFKIAGKRTPLIQPGKSRTLKVTFKKAGRYKYLCTVSGHAAAGMRGTLRVK